MAGLVKLQVQLGDNATATNNFQLTSAAADGTMKLARGNMGATTQDILSVATTGVVTANQGLAALPSVSGSFYETGTWTPTVTAQTGTFTTVSATGTYVKIGRQVTVNIFITITNAGTAGTAIFVSLPNGWIPIFYTGTGREEATTGITMILYCTGDGNIRLQTQTAVYRGSAGDQISGTITFFV